MTKTIKLIGGAALALALFAMTGASEAKANGFYFSIGGIGGGYGSPYYGCGNSRIGYGHYGGYGIGAGIHHRVHSHRYVRPDLHFRSPYHIYGRGLRGHHGISPFGYGHPFIR